MVKKSAAPATRLENCLDLMRRVWAIALLPGLATGQTTPPKKPAAPPTAKTTPRNEAASGDAPARLLDEVLMTVDNKVILLSAVEEEYAARVEGEQQTLWRTGRLPQGKKLDLRQRLLIYQQVRLQFLRRAVQSQAAWSIKGASPERIQQIVNKELQRRQQARIKEVGSLNRLRQEQDGGLLNSSEFIRERREREDILYNLQRQDFEMRFRDRVALMITPKALRARYERRAPEMRIAAAKVLGLVRFAIPDPDAADAVKARAGNAAAAWRKTTKTGLEVGKEFGGDSRSDREIFDTGKLQPFLRTFVENGAAGAVSPPIRHGSAFWVLKIVSTSPAEAFRWDDRRVQNMLKNELVIQEYEKIRVRLQRDQEKTLQIWPPLGRRPR